jgi:hypothetical protein
MDSSQSRRQFLQAGLALPAVGLTSTGGLSAVLQGTPSEVPLRTLGKTGLRVTGLGYGIGFNPVVEVVERAIDMGVNYFDTSRVYGDSEKIFPGSSDVVIARRTALRSAAVSAQTRSGGCMKPESASCRYSHDRTQ